MTPESFKLMTPYISKRVTDLTITSANYQKKCLVTVMAMM